MPPQDETEEEWPKVARKPTLVWPVTTNKKQAIGFADVKWNPIDILHLKGFKEGVISCVCHHPM